MLRTDPKTTPPEATAPGPVSARASLSVLQFVTKISSLLAIPSACSEPYSCETIGLAGESEAHGTLDVSLTSVTGTWQLQTNRIFLYSPNDGSGVSLAACDDRGGDVRTFRASIAVPIPDEMPAPVGVDWLTGYPTASVTFSHCIEEKCPEGGSVKFGLIDTRFEGEITSFDPEAAEFSADFSAISTDSWAARLDIKANFTWDSEYRAPPALPPLSGSWLVIPNVDAGPQVTTKRLTLIQDDSRVSGEICDEATKCLAVSGFISSSVLVLISEEWTSGLKFSQDEETQELLSDGGQTKLVRND